MKLYLEWSKDDRAKDSKKSPIHQFWLLVIEITIFNIQISNQVVVKCFVYINLNLCHF
jgi:hypothetical protein